MSEANNNVVVTMPGSTAARIQETGVLLEVPRYNGLPRHDVVYGLVRGQVGTAPLARYRLPERLRKTTLVSPSSVDTDGLEVLPLLAEISERVAPWVAVHVVPQILVSRADGDDYGRASGHYEIEGRRYSSAGGLACHGHDLILLRSGSPIWMAATLCHELMHMMWRRLSDAARDVLVAAGSKGEAWPGGYYADPEERVARMFEAWASARMEGMPANEDSDFWTVEGIFEWIWQGGLADHQIVRGLVPGAEALLVRRGLEPLPPPAPEPLPAPPPRPRWDYVITDWMWATLAAGVLGIGLGMRWTWRAVAAAA